MTTESRAIQWSERMMLDLLRQRHDKVHGNGPRYVFAEHVRSAVGFGAWNDRDLFVEQGGRTVRTADAIAVDLWPSSGNLVHGFEVKVSRSDWLTELREPVKADSIRRYCDHWWLVVPDATIVRNDLPEGRGVLAVGRDGNLRIRTRAPRLDRKPMPPTFVASLLRAAVRTATKEI